MAKQILIKPGISKDLVKCEMRSPLRKVKSVKSSPKSVKRGTVLRKEIRIKSPKSPKCIIRHSIQTTSRVHQRHLESVNQVEPGVVSKLINVFEQNRDGLNCFNVKDTKKTVSDQNCIREGLVRNAFELLMLQKGDNTKSRTPKRKNVKRLEHGKTTSSQKKIDKWVKK